MKTELESQKTRKAPQHQFCRRSLSLLDQIRWSVLRVTFIDLHGWKTLDYCHHSEDSNSSASVFQLKVNTEYCRTCWRSERKRWLMCSVSVYLLNLNAMNIFSGMRKHSCSFLHSRQGLHLWVNHANITLYSNITRKNNYEIIFGVIGN